MEKIRRILAACGAVLLVVMYGSTLFFAVTDHSQTMGLLKASIVCSFVIPVLLYAYTLVYRTLQSGRPPRDEESRPKKEGKEAEAADPGHIENLLEDCRVRPAVDQIEFHPGYTQEMTVRYCQEKGILVQAWSPIGRRALLDNEMLQEMAPQYGVSVAQLCIRYAIQRGVVPLPKSSAMERMEQNQDVFGFEIKEEDMYRLGTMPQTGWSGQHPDAGSIRGSER